jgi:hypothetical protein
MSEDDVLKDWNDRSRCDCCFPSVPVRSCPDCREKTAADAPCHYGPQEADAWASGYNAALSR